MNRDIKIAFVCLITVMIFAVTVPAGQAATSHEVELLWPNGAPGAKGDADGDRPTLGVYLPPLERATGAAVVICPGGGYGNLGRGRVVPKSEFVLVVVHNITLSLTIFLSKIYKLDVIKSDSTPHQSRGKTYHADGNQPLEFSNEVLIVA